MLAACFTNVPSLLPQRFLNLLSSSSLTWRNMCLFFFIFVKLYENHQPEKQEAQVNAPEEGKAGSPFQNSSTKPPQSTHLHWSAAHPSRLKLYMRRYHLTWVVERWLQRKATIFIAYEETQNLKINTYLKFQALWIHSNYSWQKQSYITITGLSHTTFCFTLPF